MEHAINTLTTIRIGMDTDSVGRNGETRSSLIKRNLVSFDLQLQSEIESARVKPVKIFILIEQ